MAHMTNKRLEEKRRNDLNRGYSSLDVKYVGSVTHKSKRDYMRVRYDAQKQTSYSKYV